MPSAKPYVYSKVVCCSAIVLVHKQASTVPIGYCVYAEVSMDAVMLGVRQHGEISRPAL